LSPSIQDHLGRNGLGDNANAVTIESDGRVWAEINIRPLKIRDIRRWNLEHRDFFSNILHPIINHFIAMSGV